MSEPELKCDNNAIFEQNYLLLQNGQFLMFQLRGKSRLSRFPPKKSFISSTRAEKRID